MTHDDMVLDLNKLASGPDSRVADMVAEFEGRCRSASETIITRTLWTEQFAASGKTSARGEQSGVRGAEDGPKMHDSLVLDLSKLASSAESSVPEMLAELEGRAHCSVAGSSGPALWTRQFAASGKLCEPSA